MKNFFRSRRDSFRNAINGFESAISTEINLRIHLVLTILVVAISLYLQISTVEWAAIFIAIGMVWSAEIMNTSIEKLVDMVSPEWNLQAKIVKDLAAGAVLAAAIAAALVGIVIFLPPIAVKIFALVKFIQSGGLLP
jgi:diacylglycerol kinase (ATP)